MKAKIKISLAFERCHRDPALVRKFRGNLIFTGSERDLLSTYCLFNACTRINFIQEIKKRPLDIRVMTNYLAANFKDLPNSL